MSLEAFGDEGSAASTWEDTAVRQELDKVRTAFVKWLVAHQRELPGPDADTSAELIEAEFDHLTDMLSGKIN